MYGLGQLKWDVCRLLYRSYDIRCRTQFIGQGMQGIGHRKTQDIDCRMQVLRHRTRHEILCMRFEVSISAIKIVCNCMLEHLGIILLYFRSFCIIFNQLYRAFQKNVDNRFLNFPLQYFGSICSVDEYLSLKQHCQQQFSFLFIEDPRGICKGEANRPQNKETNKLTQTKILNL